MRRGIITAVLPAFLFFCAWPAGAQGIITTVAGSGTFVFTGNGGPATDAPLGNVSGVAVDSAGNVYATDRGNHLVVRIAPTGILTVVAGNGKAGFSGDGGPATSASLNLPVGVAVDLAGNVFIADGGSSFGDGGERIRRVATDGAISTVAGNGSPGFSGDGGPATAAQLNRVQGVAVDSAGNLYIADTGNNRVRKVTPDGIITTVAGDGRCCYLGDNVPATSTPLNSPYAVAVDAAGALYIADTFNDRIRKVGSGGMIATVAGGAGRGYSGDGGPATAAQLNWPSGLALDSSGNLYVADSYNYRIRLLSRDGTIRTVAGTGRNTFSGDAGPAVATPLSLPLGVAVDAAGNLYIADSGNSRVRKVDAVGTLRTLAGNGNYRFSGEGGQATAASLNRPARVVIDVSGSFCISDSGNHRVRKVAPNGVITTIAGRGGNGFSGDGGPATQALLSNPSGLALDSAGNLYIADTGNRRVRRVDTGGIIATVAGSDATGGGGAGDGGPATSAAFSYPGDVAVDAAGNLYIADALDGRIRKVSPGGTISTFATFFFFPNAVALDGAGNVYVSIPALSMARRDGGVTRIGPDGTRTSVLGGLISAGRVAVDPLGNVYIPDGFERQVYKVDGSGGKVTVAGLGGTDAGFSGDGGPSTSALLNVPAAVALDAAGNLYIADSGNDRIRKVFQNPASGLPEPSLAITLDPGFYIAEVRNGQGEHEGYWGMEVLMPKGVLAGGFNLGGAMQDRSLPPGFGAFYLPSPQTVGIRLDAQVVPGGDPSRFSMSARLLDSARRPIGAEQFGTNSVQFEQALGEGFYIMEVRGGVNSPRATFQLGLNATAFGGGVNVGGFVAAGLVGFGAFYVPETQEVTVRVLGQPSYKQDGAGALQLRLLDANRNVLRTVP